MRKMIPLLALLIVASGCARSDWIERTLVTVDVTGAWEGAPASGGHGVFYLSLEQQGSQVKGRIRHVGAGSACASVAGPLEGNVAGDVFIFKQTNASISGEMTVSGDEMSGGGTGPCGRFNLTLRRISGAPGQTSPKQ
jgi:hypothetical protein